MLHNYPMTWSWSSLTWPSSIISHPRWKWTKTFKKRRTCYLSNSEISTYVGSTYLFEMPCIFALFVLCSRLYITRHTGSGDEIERIRKVERGFTYSIGSHKTRLSSEKTRSSCYLNCGRRSSDVAAKDHNTRHHQKPKLLQRIILNVQYNMDICYRTATK